MVSQPEAIGLRGPAHASRGSTVFDPELREMANVGSVAQIPMYGGRIVNGGHNGAAGFDGNADDRASAIRNPVA